MSVIFNGLWKPRPKAGHPLCDECGIEIKPGTAVASDGQGKLAHGKCAGMTSEEESQLLNQAMAHPDAKATILRNLSKK